MQALNKTKAALQSRLCRTDVFQLDNQDSTAIDQVNDFGAANLRCLYAISRFIAETINCPVLSSGSLSSSIFSTNSCGARDCNFCDLSFFVPVAMAALSLFRWSTVYMELISKKELKWIPLSDYSGVHLGFSRLKIAKPGSASTLTGPLTKPLYEVTIMAELQSTQTRPKFQYRFLALCRADLHAKPCRLSVEAETEQEARRVLAPHFILSLAARLPLVEVHHG